MTPNQRTTDRAGAGPLMRAPVSVKSKTGMRTRN